jgi:hypothetical protein
VKDHYRNPWPPWLRCLDWALSIVALAALTAPLAYVILAALAAKETP